MDEQRSKDTRSQLAFDPNDLPIFEAMGPGGGTRVFALWADGRVEGITFYGPIINRIPTRMGQARAQAMCEAEELAQKRAALHGIRDNFACMALIGMGTWTPGHSVNLLTPEGLAARASWAYAQADAMIAERSKGS